MPAPVSSSRTSSPRQTMLPFLPNSTLPQPYHLNPYPPPAQLPQIPHKVWILDCKACGTFLTNRGMKAVLLLRPNVSLYSSDALPVNCSAYTTNPDALRPRPSCRPAPAPHLSSRTCECLTQTLCCHGCGSAVGYMIVIPCARCTSSITATNRATNGHRFVFHSSEIVSTERRYVPDEPGVIPYEPVAPPFSQGLLALSLHPPHPSHYSEHIYDFHNPRSRSSSPAASSDYLPTPPLELADPSLLSSTPVHSEAFHTASPNPSEPYLSLHAPNPSVQQHHLSSPNPSAYVPPDHLYHLTTRPSAAAPSQPLSPRPFRTHPTIPFALPAPEFKDQIHPRKLETGDVLYWHHLAKTGEIPGVCDDQRARGKDASISMGGKHPAFMTLDR